MSATHFPVMTKHHHYDEDHTQENKKSYRQGEGEAESSKAASPTDTPRHQYPQELRTRHTSP